ncbi:MAG: hypothetical protein QW507_02885 [Candidatus Nanoarchaeia archaeon]|nr:hypothetical protein [Candidatus Haiyanarchaeum thermophilum]MCW1303061.1 hypothetical protein [Candidatus Haiyanarchaeum thermophilum]MCW1303726.1 hypothetical protein [Candidatus Haiyanarchaeum thermophilum]MCW1306829.1 hypothetical protein [Candidatus Haiyanarchaeum thermophilum]MCW1307071.1 hypothetical protein [Candidatus Haiyanarchaeum thermophilum]
MKFKLTVIGLILTLFAAFLLLPAQFLGSLAEYRAYFQTVAEAKIYNVELPLIILLIGLIILFWGLKR